MGRVTRTLYLLRHAKSSWKESGLADHDRPLAGRGKRAAEAMGAYLRAHDIAPDLVLCSSSVRTRHTLKRLDLTARAVHIERELYAADAPTLLARLRDVPKPVGSVMLIGHNPGLEDLASVLATPSPQLEELAAKFPTAALATLTFDRDWGSLEKGTAELVGFVKPREL
jgi:phosphohistidine phosphatase